MRQRLRGLRRALLLALVAGLLLSGCASLSNAAARRSAVTVTPAPTPTAAQAIAGRLDQCGWRLKPHCVRRQPSVADTAQAHSAYLRWLTRDPRRGILSKLGVACDVAHDERTLAFMRRA